jgi:hypothetical protein
LPEEALVLSPEQHKANRRLGLILASVALAFFLGFVAKLLWGGQ